LYLIIFSNRARTDVETAAGSAERRKVSGRSFSGTSFSIATAAQTPPRRIRAADKELNWRAVFTSCRERIELDEARVVFLEAEGQEKRRVELEMEEAKAMLGTRRGEMGMWSGEESSCVREFERDGSILIGGVVTAGGFLTPGFGKVET
jgi:hypothetical protein